MALTDNLVLCLEMDEASGVRYDSHATFDATDNNTVDSDTGIIHALAAKFTQSNSEYLSVAYDAAMDATTNWSAAMWVYLLSGGDASYCLASRMIFNTDNCWEWESVGGEMRLRVANAATDFSQEAQKSSLLSTGSWCHIGVTYDGSGSANADRVKFYKDGAAVSSLSFAGTIPATMRTSSSPLHVGRWNGLGRYANMRAQQFAMWNRTLESTEFGTLYGSGSGLAYSSWAAGPATARRLVSGGLAGRSPLLGGLVR